MANEISEGASLSVNNTSTGLKLQYPFETKSITQNAGATAPKSYVDTVLVAAAAESDVPIGSITTPGRVVFKNVGANYVKAGPKSGGVMVEAMRLMPGEHQSFRYAPAAVWRWRADTADCMVLIFLLAD